MKHESRGFTLVEMVVVLTIIGLLIGGLLIPLTTQIDVAKIQRTENILEQTKQALIQYAMRNNRLPCPEMGCDKLSGSLPWERLGVGRYDAWGNPIQYHVDPNYADKIVIENEEGPGTDWATVEPPGFEIIDVRGNQLVAQTDVVAIIFSYGKNGLSNQEKLDLLPISAKMDLERYYPIEKVINFVFTRALAAGWTAPYIKGEPLSKQGSDDILRWLSRNYLIAVGKQPLQVLPETTVLETMVSDLKTITDPYVAMPQLAPTTDPGTDPTPSDPGTTDPTTTDPGTTDPTTTDPGTTDPTTTDPGTTDPTTTDPGTTDPTTTDPGTTDPTTTDPGTTDPTTTDPGTTDPTTTDPGTTDPTTTDPGTTDPTTTDPGTTDPTTTDPGTTDPTTTDPGTPDPTGTDPETKVDDNPWASAASVGSGSFSFQDDDDGMSGSSGDSGFDPSGSGFGEKGAIEGGSFPSQ